MHLPTTQEIKVLHQKYARSREIFDLVWNHCCIVRDIAEQLIDNYALTLDTRLVSAGCLLHDIGVYPLFDANSKLHSGISYVLHGPEGQKILEAEGFPEAIWRFASHHTGVGLSGRDILKQKLPLPVEDYFAETDEELLVMYADKFHSKTMPPHFNSFVSYKREVAKFGSDKVATFESMAKQFGIPTLEPLSAKYQYEIR